MHVYFPKPCRQLLRARGSQRQEFMRRKATPTHDFHRFFRYHFHALSALSLSDRNDLVSPSEAIRDRLLNACEAGATPPFDAPCVTAGSWVAPASREEVSFWCISVNLKEISPVERHIFRAKRRIDIYRGRFCSDPFFGGSSMSRPPSPTNIPPLHARQISQLPLWRVSACWINSDYSLR